VEYWKAIPCKVLLILDQRPEESVDLTNVLEANCLSSFFVGPLSYDSNSGEVTYLLLFFFSWQVLWVIRVVVIHRNTAHSTQPLPFVSDPAVGADYFFGIFWAKTTVLIIAFDFIVFFSNMFTFLALYFCLRFLLRLRLRLLLRLQLRLIWFWVSWAHISNWLSVVVLERNYFFNYTENKQYIK